MKLETLWFKLAVIDNIGNKMKRIGFSWQVLSILAGLYGFISTAQATTAVRMSTVETQLLQPRVRVTGTLKAVAQTSVAANEPGLVTQVFVNEGDNVVANQVLLQLDDQKLRLQKEQLNAQYVLATSQYKISQAELKLAEQDQDSARYSANKNAISAQQLRQSEASKLIAQSKLNRADEAIKTLQAQLKIIDVRLDDMQPKAPFAGQVTARTAELGQWLNLGDSALVVTSQGDFEAWLDVPERFAAKLMALNETTPKLQIGISVADSRLDGNNLKILQQVDSRARTFKLVAQVRGLGLMPGMSVSGWIPQGKRIDTLVVPKDAIVKRGRDTSVFRVVNDGEQQMAEQIPVLIDFHQGNYVAISASILKVGDQVITEGNERLSPGPVIAIMESMDSL
jgi:RND family efflux transporter MFP subunit